MQAFVQGSRLARVAADVSESKGPVHLVRCSKGGYGDFCFTPPDPFFYAGASGRSWKERIYRSDPPPQLVTAGVNTYSHFFFLNKKRTQSTSRSAPAATLMHVRVIVRLTYWGAW